MPTTTKPETPFTPAALRRFASLPSHVQAAIIGCIRAACPRPRTSVRSFYTAAQWKARAASAQEARRERHIHRAAERLDARHRQTAGGGR